MKVALHSVLREGQEAAYEREHAEVWPDLLAALRRAGIRDWTIWRSGRNLFHLVDTDDFAAAMDRLDDDEVNQRWQDHMAAFVDHFEPNGEGQAGLAIRHVWTLRDQVSREHGPSPDENAP